MLIRGDARRIPLRDESVQCIVTSPPYWGLRDYGVRRQIGLERTPEEYIETMLDVFRECWRVLRGDGTLWLNLGDGYSTGGNGAGAGKQRTNKGSLIGPKKLCAGYKRKDLVGIPWAIAFALRADGWYLRSEIIWHKPNPMPESVTDRPTKAHEQIFLLSKEPRYYYDADAIREPASKNTHPRGNGLNPKAVVAVEGSRQNSSFSASVNKVLSHRNKRTVWTVPSHPYPDAHYATFPPKLIEPCILAGAPVGGVVFDPFVGSGTTVRVARKHNRIGIGLDLAYQDLAIKRISNVQRVFVEAG